MFWVKATKEAYSDFWLCLADLGLVRGLEDAENANLLSNILEKYLALVFRSLSQRIPCRDLPSTIDRDFYPRNQTCLGNAAETGVH